jgi:hypothetical protein
MQADMEIDPSPLCREPVRLLPKPSSRILAGMVMGSAFSAGAKVVGGAVTAG